MDVDMDVNMDERAKELRAIKQQYILIRQPTYGKNVIVRRTTGGHMPDSFFSTQHFFETWNEGFEWCPDIVVKQCAVQTTLFAE
jgi:hypothetical protein